MPLPMGPSPIKSRLPRVWSPSSLIFDVDKLGGCGVQVAEARDAVAANSPIAETRPVTPTAQRALTLMVVAQLEAARDSLTAMFPTHATKIPLSTWQANSDSPSRGGGHVLMIALMSSPMPITETKASRILKPHHAFVAALMPLSFCFRISAWISSTVSIPRAASTGLAGSCRAWCRSKCCAYSWPADFMALKTIPSAKLLLATCFNSAALRAIRASTSMEDLPWTTPAKRTHAAPRQWKKAATASNPKANAAAGTRGKRHRRGGSAGASVRIFLTDNAASSSSSCSMSTISSPTVERHHGGMTDLGDRRPQPPRA
mmetsp:Transcript_14429/g.32858  ORF Transcript_14429/g.32858 Transcript_14429/m.32858 type:complete len:316 (-) Transcript_14429:2-949(-)